MANKGFILLKPTLPKQLDYMNFRQGSNGPDSSSSTVRSSLVMLSEAKHLVADRDRSFAKFTSPIIAFNMILGISVGADLSRTSPIHRPSLAFSDSSFHLFKFIYPKPNCLLSIMKHSSECLYKPRSQHGF
jgi:hypothetical protein